MGQAMTNRLTGLSATNARLAVTTAASVVVFLVAGVLAAAGVADGEIVATVLFLPVFVVALYAGRTAGFVAAAVALAVYVAVRKTDLQAADTASAVMLAATRGVAYGVAAHLGARARGLIGSADATGGPAGAGAGGRPSPRTAAAAWSEPAPQWTEPAYASGPDRGAPVLTGVGARSNGDWPGEPAAPMTMSNSAWPPPPAGPPPGWDDDARRTGAPGGNGAWAGDGPRDSWAGDDAGDESWEAVQQSWRRQHGLPPEDPEDDPDRWPPDPAPRANGDDHWPPAPSRPADEDTGHWPPAPSRPADEDIGHWPPAPSRPADEDIGRWQPAPFRPADDDTGRWSIPASPAEPAAPAPGWGGPAPVPGGPGWGAPPPAPDAWQPPGNGSSAPASDTWAELAGDAWPAAVPPENGRSDHGPATGETWAAVFTDPETGRGPATGEHQWGPDDWPQSHGTADDWPPSQGAADDWPQQLAGPQDEWPHRPPGSPLEDPWPPAPPVSPDGWPHEPQGSPRDSWPPTAAASPRDSWPPTAAVSPDDTWASLAPPETGWPPPAAPAEPSWSAAPAPDDGWSPVAGGGGWPGAPSPPSSPAPPWAAGVPEPHVEEAPPEPLPAVDPETGLWTARFLRDRLSAERARSRRSRHPFSLVLVQVPDAPLAMLPYRRQLTLLRELGYQFVAGGVVDHLVHVPDQDQHWFAVILPDTDRSGAQVLERRLRLGIGGYLSSRGLRLSELQSASLTAPDDDPAMSAIWDALIGPEDADDPSDRATLL
ncbi:MAG TPA: hypothetical protein VH479_23640 [Acidimicrobiales bacterium]